MSEIQSDLTLSNIPGIGCWIVEVADRQFVASGWRKMLSLESEPQSLEEWYECVHEEDRDKVRASVEEFLAAANVAETPPKAFQLDFRGNAKGDFRWLLLKAEISNDEETGQPFQMVVTSFDITLLRTVLERETHSLITENGSVASSQTIANSAPVLIWSTNEKGRCGWFNEHWLDFTGQTFESALAVGRCGRIHPEDRDQVLAAFAAAFELSDSIQLEYRLQKHDGTYRWMLDRSAPRFDEQSNCLGYVGVCVDVTHEYEFRQRLADRERMLAVLHDINDRERSFLACAIHDGILQDIIGADMLLQNLPVDAEASAKVVAIRETLRSALRHGRRLISELRPLILDEQGLFSAIEFYAAEIENRGTVSFHIRNELPDLQLCGLWAGNVFRIVQSAMNNIESHSECESASIDIRRTADEQLLIKVSDEGVGFDLEQYRNSFGIRCICERAELFGGSVEFVTSPGNGCHVELCVPMPSESS